MPVLQVQDRILRRGEPVELLAAPGLADLTGLTWLAPSCAGSGS